MELCWDVAAPCEVFVIVSPHAIFSCIRPQCYYWCSENDVVYWFSSLCDPLEEFNPFLEVLTIPVQEKLWTPHPPQPPFIKWHNLVIKYRAGGMRCSAWLNFPTKDYILSVFIFVESRDSLMSFIQAASFCLGRNTQDKCVWMFQTRNVLCSSRRPYPASLWRNRGLY